MLVGRDIVCVGFNDWDNEIWTNQHHLMSRLATRNRVLFVESLGLRRPTLSGRDVRRIARRLRRGLAGPRTADGGVRVLSPLVLPFHGSRTARAVNARLLPALVRRAARRAGVRPRPILWAYVPQAEALIDALGPGIVVYHCVDDIAVQDGVDAEAFAAAERRLLAHTDLVLASAPPIAARLRALGADPVYAPNVADVNLFAAALAPGPVDPALAALPAPRIVFVGAVAAVKLDVELIVGVARARPSWSICLIGPVGLGDPTGDLSALAAEPSVHLLGPRTQAELPAALRGAAAGVIPYRRSALTDSIFPMKVFEYLAAGLGVVATPLPSLTGEPGIATASDVPSFVAALDRIVGETGDEARRERGRLAAGRSWNARLEEIAGAIARVEAARAPADSRGDARPLAAADLPRVALIAVSYEAAGVLPGFLASLRHLNYPGWECLVIDNASADESVAIARAAQIDGLRVVEAGANLGFGTACNLGAALTDSELLVFLNLDLEMPPDWLRTVVGHLVGCPDVAVICPATVAPGAQPDVREHLEDVTTMPACAMVMRRRDFEAAGGFDERIFLYWEDTDLCWRTKLRGRRVVKDHSAYVVHHRGGTGGGDRMSAEQVKNGLYVHLKLASARKTVPFVARMLAKTGIRFLQTRDPALLRAWSDNARRLPRTLRSRREVLAGVPSTRRREVEALLVSQQRWRRSALSAALRRP